MGKLFREGMAAGIGSFTEKASASYNKWILPARSNEMETIQVMSDEEEDTEHYVRAFSELGLQLSCRQVRQLLSSSSCTTNEENNVIKRQSEEPDNDLSFTQFCVFASEVAHHHSSCQLSRSDEGSMERRYIKPVREKLNSTGSECLHEVFLGGSCNPTAWRRDQSIPLLEREGVTYYNPQVDKWTPELVDIEEQAKQNAISLLFVIDDQTRACSSLVETAYLIGKEETLVVVVNDFLSEMSQIAGEPISEFEFPGLRKGRLIIKDLIYSHNILIEPDVKRATEMVVKVVKELLTEQELMRKLEENRIANKIYNENILSKLHYMFTMYDNNRSNSLTFNEACLALQSLKVLSPFTTLSSLLPSLPLSRWESDGMSFDDFCLLYSELRYQSSVSLGETVRKGWVWSVGNYLWSSVQWLSGLIWRPFPPPPPPSDVYDIYLGGTIDETNWRKDTVLPLLIKNGVSYFNPSVHNEFSFYVERIKRSCSLLLFVITSNTTGVPELIEAAYSVGEGRKEIVLCIEEMKTDIVDRKLLTPRALKDYNRARAYLTSLANKNRIPVHSNISDATLCSIHRLRHNKL